MPFARDEPQAKFIKMPDDLSFLDKYVKNVDVSDLLERMRGGTFEQESGGNYQVRRNQRTGAVGGFQVMPANIPNWTKNYLGRSYTPDEFERDPKAQEAVFSGEMGKYLRKARRIAPDDDTAIRMAAAAWYGGEGAMKRYDDPNRFRPNEPSFREYTQSVLKRSSKRPNLSFLDKYVGTETPTFLDKYLLQESVPEPAETIALQRDRAANPKIKSRTGVLLNKGDTPQPSEWEGFGKHEMPDGRTMMVHAESAAKNLKLKTPEEVDTFIKKNPAAIARMTGIVDDVGTATGNNQPVVTAQVGGKEAASAVVTNPTALHEQRQVYKEQFPEATIGVTTTDQIVKQRQAEQPEMPEAPEQIATDADFIAANEYLKSVGQPEMTREQFDVAQKGNFQAQATGYQTKLEAPQQAQGQGQVSVPRRGRTQVAAPAAAQPKSEGFSIEIGLTDKPANQTYGEWVQGKTASGIAKKLGVSYDAVRRAMAKFPATIGKTSTNKADEDYYAGLVKQGDMSTLLQVKGEVIAEIKRQDAGEKEATAKLAASREKLLASNPNLDVSPEMLDVMAAQDAGLIGKNEGDKKLLQARNDYIDWLVNNGYAEESAIKKAFGIKENTEPISAAEWALKSNPIANLLGLGVENKSRVPQQIQSGITKDILEYGSLAEANKAYKKQQEQRKFSESSGLGFGQPTESLKTAARYIAKIPATILETGAVLTDASIFENAYRSITGQESGIRPALMQAAKSWRETVDTDKALAQNPAYRSDWIVNEGAEAFAQLGVQLVGASLTGGATLAFPLAEGGTAQYREADEAGAGQVVRLTVAAAGAALAVPDLLLKAKYLRGISKAGQFKFIESLTSRLYSKFAQQAAPELAKEATELTVKAFAKSLSKNAAFGTIGEQQQERWEDVGNKALAKVLYKPSITWEDVFVPTAAEKRGYWAAGLAGAGGGTVETAIQRMSDTELARGQEVVSQMLADKRIKETDAARITKRIEREQQVRTKIAPYFAADKQIQSEVASQPETQAEQVKETERTQSAIDGIVAQGLKHEFNEGVPSPDDLGQGVWSKIIHYANRHLNHASSVDDLLNVATNFGSAKVRSQNTIHALVEISQRGDAWKNFISELEKTANALTAKAKAKYDNSVELSYPSNAIARAKATYEEAKAHNDAMVSFAKILDRKLKADIAKSQAEMQPETQAEQVQKLVDPPVKESAPERLKEPTPVTDTKEADIVATGQPKGQGVAQLKEQRDTARREAERDTLTKLANPTALEKALPAAEADPQTAVIAFDANNLGKVNKIAGHETGDKAIIELADAIKQAASEFDNERVFRRGGDEFVVLADKDTADQIRQRAEEIYGSKQYGDAEVSLSGTVGNTFKEADSTLQAAKAERKAKVAEPAIPTRSEAAVVPPAEVEAAPVTRKRGFARAAKAESQPAPQEPQAKPKTPPMQMATAKRQTDTPEFRKWFGKSAVVDEKGEPLRVYRGDVVSKQGIFFTSSPDTAEGYTIPSFIRGGNARQTTAAYLSLQNPLVIDALGKRHDNIPVPWSEWKQKVFGNLPDTAVSVEGAYKYALEHGYDGLIVKHVVDTADPTERAKPSDVYAVKNQTQIKSAIGNRGTFDPKSANILEAKFRPPSEPFYSRVTSVIKDKMPPRATPAQITALLAKNSVKELDPEMQVVKVWLGEQGGVVRKEDVLAFVEANKTAVSEIVKGGNEAWQGNDLIVDGEQVATLVELDDGKWSFQSDYFEGTQPYDSKAEAQSAAEEATIHDPYSTRGVSFAQWQLPGEKENYREEFLTAPPEQIAYQYEVRKLHDDKIGDYYTVWNTATDENVAWGYPKRDKASMTNLAKSLNAQHKGYLHNRNTWKDGHSDYDDVVNPIARIRYNDRTTTDGDKMLFVEEIQQPSKDNVAKMPKVYQKYGEEMAIRKMLYRAVEGGYDYLGLTTGQQQADRYDLSKQVDRVHWSKKHSRLIASHRGQVLIDEKNVTADNLENYIGKEPARRLLDAPDVPFEWASGSAKLLTGDDLKVGGEGLIRRYDVKHVDYINKIMKPYGVQVESKELVAEQGNIRGDWAFRDGRIEETKYGDFDLFGTRKDTGEEVYLENHDTRAEAERQLALMQGDSTTQTVHAVRISPEFKVVVEASMREQGGAFPMFAKNEPTPEMVKLKETLAAPNIEVARYTRTGSQVKFDNLNAWVMAMQAADEAFDGNHLSKGLTLYGDNLEAYQKALTDFRDEMAASPDLYSKKAIDGLERFIKTVEDAAKVRRRGTVELILTADAIVEENVHATDVQRMAEDDILDSISPEYFKRVQESELFKNAKDFLDTYGYNVNNEVKAKMAVYEFATKLRAGRFEELGIDPVKYREEIIEGVADWIQNFKEIEGIDLSGAEYETISETTAFLYKEAKARMAQSGQEAGQTGREVGQDKQLADVGKGEKGSDLAGDKPREDSGVSKIGKSIEAKAIEQGLTEGFPQTAGYDKKHVQDQIDRINKLITEDVEAVREMALGLKPIPPAISPVMLLRGMEEVAKAKKDVQLQYELANSPLVSETSYHAQEMRMMQEREQDSATALIQSLRRERATKMSKWLRGRTVEEAIKEEAEKMAATMKTHKRRTATRENWDSFIASIEC